MTATPSTTDGAAVTYDPFDPVTDSDPHPTWKRLRDEAPVYFNEQHNFYTLSRFEDVWAAYHDTETFSSTHGVMIDSLDAPIDTPVMIFMDPPEHDAMRKLVSRAFTPRRIAELETTVEHLVETMLDPFIGVDTFDYVEDFAAQLPPIVMGRLLGIPDADLEMARHWMDEALRIEPDGTQGDGPLNAMLKMLEYVGSMVAERRAAPRDDFMGALIDAEIDDDGVTRRLTDEEVTNFVLLLVGAGVETVARLLSWAGVLLARFADQRQIVASDLSLVPNTIEELLRYEAPSPRNGRWTLKPSTFHGITIPAGSKVLMLNGSANRDDREFEDADKFDVQRHIKRHITFGYGAHFCLGAALARLEARVALSGTLARFPTWGVNEDELKMVRASTVRGYSSVPIHLP